VPRQLHQKCGRAPDCRSIAVAVFSPQRVQIGYVNAERAPYVGLRMGRGEDVAAIFQGIDGGSAFIRARFGGRRSDPAARRDHSTISIGFRWPEWGT
jgi:hypothetical protein